MIRAYVRLMVLAMAVAPTVARAQMQVDPYGQVCFGLGAGPGVEACFGTNGATAQVHGLIGSLGVNLPNAGPFNAFGCLGPSAIVGVAQASATVRAGVCANTVGDIYGRASGSVAGFGGGVRITNPNWRWRR